MADTTDSILCSVLDELVKFTATCKVLAEMIQHQSVLIAEQKTDIARLTEKTVALTNKMYQQSLVIAEIRSAQQDEHTRLSPYTPR